MKPSHRLPPSRKQLSDDGRHLRGHGSKSTARGPFGWIRWRRERRWQCWRCAPTSALGIVTRNVETKSYTEEIVTATRDDSVERKSFVRLFKLGDDPLQGPVKASRSGCSGMSDERLESPPVAELACLR